MNKLLFLLYISYLLQESQFPIICGQVSWLSQVFPTEYAEEILNLMRIGYVDTGLRSSRLTHLCGNESHKNQLAKTQTTCQHWSAATL